MCLPFIRKQSNSFMSDGATRYSTSRKNKGIYYTLVIFIFFLTGLIFYGYREYENLNEQNKHFVTELNTLRTTIGVYPNMNELLGQNRLLMDQNRLLGDEVLRLRAENAKLHGDILVLEETVPKPPNKVKNR